jgi:predicted RNase H-like nuclease (RuvC/YqgF family)
MSANTKQILAITLGSVGLVLAIVAAIIAYNAKQAADDNKNVATQVDERFAEEQAKQDAREKRQASDAEKFVARLDSDEKSLLRKINKQSNQIGKLRQKTRNLGNQVDSQGKEISSLESQEKSDVNSLNQRINNTNQRIDKTNARLRNLNR